MKIRHALIALLLFQSAWAENEHRDHGAHVHGHASLNLAISGNELLIELNSPAMNLIGFEHQSSSEQDKITLQRAVNVLRNPSQWLKANRAASCQLLKMDLDSKLLNDERHEEGHSENHQDEHEGQHEDDHAHSEYHDENENQEIHADFNLVLQYHCNYPARLHSVDLAGLFKSFRGMEEIEVQWITGSQQSATELNPINTIISLP